eukprot:689906-Pyramimonas_sp.AAC.1
MDGGRAMFKMWLSPYRRAGSFQKPVRATRMEGGRFSECGFRPSAAHIIFWSAGRERTSSAKS